MWHCNPSASSPSNPRPTGSYQHQRWSFSLYPTANTLHWKLYTYHTTYFGPNLVAALAGLNVHYFSHFAILMLVPPCQDSSFEWVNSKPSPLFISEMLAASAQAPRPGMPTVFHLIFNSYISILSFHIHCMGCMIWFELHTILNRFLSLSGRICRNVCDNGGGESCQLCCIDFGEINENTPISDSGH